MIREKYDSKKEWEIIGSYPAIKAMSPPGIRSSNGIPGGPKFYRPVEPRKNLKMFFDNEKPYWLPEIGWFNCDVIEFRPRQHPENFANHQCMDGGDVVDWDNVDNVNEGWFNLPFEYEPLSTGATVRPGNPILPEINGWDEKLKFPNLDTDINWDEIKEMNSEYCFTDKATQLGIQFGFWERLMCLMDVSNAAVALIDPDQQKEVKCFLDKLADLYVSYIEHMIQVVRIDSIQLHDDWGTQNGPFFSLDTAMEFFVQPLRKVTDCCHKHGILFEHHCCGNAGDLVPAMIEAGDDWWYPQSNINNIDILVEKYKNEFTFAVPSPMLEKGLGESDVKEIAKQFVEKWCDKHVVYSHNSALRNNPNYDRGLYPLFQKYVYEYSRQIYE